MTDLSALGLSPVHEDEWREFFRSGRVFSAPVDRARLQRRTNVNTTVLAVTGSAVGVAVVGAVAATIADFGRAATYILLVLLIVAAGFVFVKFWFARRRLRAGLTSTDDYLVVSSEGICFAGHVDLPWPVVFGGIGIDGRDASGPGSGRAAMRISRAAGVPESEFVLGVRGVRAIRDAAPQGLRGVFEIIGDHGGIRIPLDTVLAPEDVRASLAAICVSAHLAGVRAGVSNDQSAVFRATTAVLGEPEKFDSAMP